ncbi:MAG: cob(I)yrinic acid a,c-diamide adenosyltransferase [Candidatus Melainabacteria bacterium]|nr:cob(I)yrinic acid a,c-diamide adenosyltransferase [Candidatus Melainabacteria bacterium]
MTSSIHSPTQERIRLYLGTGCGKTTATFGLLLRAISCGKTVTLVFFDKLEANSSEGKGLRLLSQANDPAFGKLQVYYTGVNRIGTGPLGSFRFYGSPNGILPEDTSAAMQGLAYVKEALHCKHDIVICDELLDIGRVGIISWDEIRPVLQLRSDPTVLVLTGRRAPDWLMDMATTISSTVQLRHHGRAIQGMDC